MKTKIHVITDEKGRILATLQGVAGSHGDLPIEKPVALPGQKVHEIELPKECEGLRDADELHKRLQAHVS